MGRRLLAAPGEARGGAISIVGTQGAEMRQVAARLVGVPIPSVVLTAAGEYALNLRQFACAYPLVIYLYPGWANTSEMSCRGKSRESCGDTALMDAMQHRAFRDHQSDLEARGYRAIGVSSQSVEAQRRAMIDGRLTQRLLSDPGLGLAEQLQLPTFTEEGVRWYRRLTLVVHDGRVVKVFFPVSSAARSAAQVIAWMTIQGIS
jgi:peroxiredoxin